MPDQIIFRGAYIRRFSVNSSTNGDAVFVKAVIGCDFSKNVREAMNWGELPPGFNQANLEGELNAQTMTLDPGSELAQHKIEMPIAIAESFQVVSLVVPDKPNRLELRFVVRTPHIKATRILDDYFRTLGHKKGQLRISYTEGDPQKKLALKAKGDDQQEELPLTGAAAEQHKALTERPVDAGGKPLKKGRPN